MEPPLMVLGHAAGGAAADAARRGVAVQDVDVASLEESLHARRAGARMISAEEQGEARA
jgi:hypothetical protein